MCINILKLMATALLILSSCLFYACTSPPPDKKDVTPTAVPQEKIVLYQIITRLFGNKKTTNKPYGTIEENGVGKFNDINDAALNAIRDMGFTHVWYTGVIEHALVNDYTAYGIPLDDADVIKGRAGSPYSIKDYYDVNPDLAEDVNNRMGEFESLVRRTHEKGLKVIIDFVPNHVARFYQSDAKPEGVKDFGTDDDDTKAFDPGNNFYYLPGEAFRVPSGYDPLGAENNFPTKDGKFEEHPAKATGNDKFAAQPDVNDWFEAVKLNYGVDLQNDRTTHFDPVPDTWHKMRDILLYWTGKQVDGFRCDMAEMVPVEFWAWVIPQVKQANPDIIFIAEIYNPAQYRNYIHTGKFDYLYDKVQLYDTLRLLINGQSSADHIAGIQHSLEDINRHMLHFLENHDEQRIASPFFAGEAGKALPAMVVSAAIDPGPVMIYFGQEVGEPGAGVAGFSGEDGRTTHFDYWGVPEHQKWMNDGAFDGGKLTHEQNELRLFYIRLLRLCNSHEALISGKYTDLNRYNRKPGEERYSDRIYAFLRYTQDEQLLVVVNFETQGLQANILIPENVLQELNLDPANRYRLSDVLMGGTRVVEAGEMQSGITMELSPLATHIFKIEQTE